jgi:hypothetical protein
MILVLTEARDRHADRVCQLLEQRRAPFTRFDPADLPASAALSFHITGRQSGAVLRTAGGAIALDEVSMVWYRRPRRPRPPPALKDARAREFVADECQAFLRNIYESVPLSWFPAAPAVLTTANHRLLQLQVAARLGFDVPDTLATNVRSEAIAFYNAHGGMVSSKLISQPRANGPLNDFCTYCQPLSPRDLAHFPSVAACPSLFQQYVEKKSELRVTLVDDQVFAAEVGSQTTNRTKQDWRRYDVAHTPHRPVSLPPVVRQRCLALTRHFGLRYGAIDLILTPADRYVFLEINPNGQYLWLERAAGLPISQAICDALVGRAASDAAIAS